MDLPERTAFRNLVARGRRAKLRAARQNENGAYASTRRIVSDELLDKHFSGRVTLGFRICDERGRACYLCLDIDRGAQSKLADIARVLERRSLIDASIVTTGSDAERAKVLVFFERCYASSSLQHLARTIYAEAQALGRWPLEHEASSVQFFPALGEGGILRIGGRNRKPNRNATACDALLSAWGEVRSFADVEPCKRLRAEGRDFHPIAPAPRGEWVEKLLTEGITFGDGSKRVLSVLFRLANEAMRLGIGERGYRGWCDRLWSASPAMHGPSPSGDSRSERSWDRKCDAAWDCASKRHSGTFRSPGSPIGANGMYRTATSNAEIVECIIVRFVREYARAKGFRADCVAVSIREIMQHLGCSLGTAQRKRKAAIDAGRVVVHDPGTRGERGLKAIIGVVEPWETPGQVRERCRDRENMRARRASHERYAAKIAESERAKRLRAEEDAAGKASRGSSGEAPTRDD